MALPATANLIVPDAIYNLAVDHLGRSLADAPARHDRAAKIVSTMDACFSLISGLDLIGDRNRVQLERATALRYIAQANSEAKA